MKTRGSTQEKVRETRRRCEREVKKTRIIRKQEVTRRWEEREEAEEKQN